jgi:Ca-activated chloride channel family protein
MILKQFYLAFLLFIGLTGDIDRIAKINSTTKEAEKAFINKDYKTAIEKYSYLVNTLKVSDSKALLNLAHAYYRSGNAEDAHASYTLLTSTEDPKIRSIAWQQLGVLAYEQKDIEKALTNFKEALKANPRNEEARFNYELLKKMDRPEKEQQQKNSSQDNKDKDNKQQDKKQDQQQPEESKDSQEKKSGDKSEKQEQNQSEESQKKENKQKEQEQAGKEDPEKKESGKDKNTDQQKEQDAEKGKKSGEKEKLVVDRQQLERMNLTEEKARMLLDAMRQNEVQYIQQKQHKATSAPDKSRPDW